MITYEEHRKAIVGIITNTNVVAGTGFFLGPHGHIITCHHVVAKLDKINVRIDNKQDLPVVLDEDLSVPACDIAVLRLETPPSHFLEPLIVDNPAEAVVWSAGYQYFGQYIDDIFPSGEGMISGTTAINLKGLRLASVFRISNPDISFGISGGPLLIKQFPGKVIGVVNADFAPGGGFAVPLTTICVASTTFAAFIQRHQALAAEKERHEKLKKRQEVFRQQVSIELDRLKQQGKFLPVQFYPRNTITDYLKNFLNTDYLFFPLLGDAGTGKTSLLAAFADQAVQSGYHLLFFSAYRLRLLEGGIRETLQQQLNRLPGALDVSWIDEKVLIIIDGANELPSTDHQELLTWLEDSIDWFRSVRSKVIISCRPEFWSRFRQVFPHELSCLDSKGSPFELKDFEEKEFPEVLQRYGLPAPLLTTNVLRHPLFLRIYWTNARPADDTSSFSIFKVFVDFIDAICQRISGRTNRSASFIRLRLQHIVESLVHNDGYSLLADQYYAFSQNQPEIEDAFVGEQLFVRTATNSFRINFDQVGEFLAGGVLLSQGKETIPWHHITSLSPFQRAAASFALLQMEHEGSSIEAPVQQLSNSITSARIRGDAFMFFFRSTSLLASPSAVAPDIVAFFQAYHDASGDPLTYHFIQLYVQRISLPRASLLALARVGIFYNYWADVGEMKQWRRQTAKEFHEQFSRDHILGPLLASTDLATFHWLLTSLSDWISDHRNLGDEHSTSQATVSSFACGIFFHYRNRDINFAIELLAEHAAANLSKHLAKDSSRLTLLYIAEADPDPMTTVIDRWHREGRYPELSMECLESISRTPGGLSAASISLLSDYLKDQSPFSDGVLSCVNALMTIPDQRKAMLQLILDWTGKNFIEPVQLLHTHFDDNFDILFPALCRLIDHGPLSSHLKAECAKVVCLANLSGDRITRLAIYISAFFDNPDRDKALITIFSMGVESQLYKVAPADEGYTVLMEAARIAILEQNDAGRSVCYYLCLLKGPPAVDQEKVTLLMEVINRTGPDTDRIITELFVRRGFGNYTNEAFHLFKAILLKSHFKMAKSVIALFWEETRPGMISFFERLLSDDDLQQLSELRDIRSLISQGHSLTEAIQKVSFSF